MMGRLWYGAFDLDRLGPKTTAAVMWAASHIIRLFAQVPAALLLRRQLLLLFL
jgi:hypothetical protein